MKDFKAPPGYSNHSNGMAVDFNTTQAKQKYAAKKKQNDAWKKTWFHDWLTHNARRFGFKPLSTEAWHWDYDPSVKPPAKG
jgi:LAS superfamily LD-carboxypeptidase LdcB